MLPNMRKTLVEKKSDSASQPADIAKHFMSFPESGIFYLFSLFFFFQSSFVTDFIPREERVARSDGLARFDVDEEVNDEGEAHYAHRRAPRVK